MKLKILLLIALLNIGFAFAHGADSAQSPAAQQKPQDNNLQIGEDDLNGVKVIMVKYVEDVRKKILSNWVPVKYLKTYKLHQNNITAKVLIAKNGELLNSKIIVSHGNKAAEESVMNAIALSAPFEPLPENYPQDAVSISVLFSVNR